MTSANAALVVLGGMMGAPARYLLDRAITVRTGGRWPFGILAANVLGSAVLGALAGAASGSALLAFAGAGFCGALTTFSTFGWDTVRLAEAGRPVAAAGNALLNVALCLGAVFAAASATRWVWS